ncbi:MAG TPA: hypothetical protein VF331_13120 [Polyangiales bacterium]
MRSSARQWSCGVACGGLLLAAGLASACGSHQASMASAADGGSASTPDAGAPRDLTGQGCDTFGGTRPSLPKSHVVYFSAPSPIAGNWAGIYPPPEPTFFSSAANDPADPLYPTGFASGYDASYFSNGGDGVEFLQVKYAPSGDSWASFVKNMCPTRHERLQLGLRRPRQLEVRGCRGPPRAPAVVQGAAEAQGLAQAKGSAEPAAPAPRHTTPRYQPGE